MGDGRLVSVPEARNIGMEVCQTSCHSLGDVAKLVPGYHVGFQIISQGTL